jgi:GTPase SAR1 family protein
MKGGYVDSIINKIVLSGAAGTGKSSFMTLIIGDPPLDVRSSTPLAARPVSLFQINVTHEKWRKLSRQERREILVQAMMSSMGRPSRKDSTSSDDDSTSSDEEKTVNEPVPVSIDTEHASSTQDPHLQPVAPPASSPRLHEHNHSQPDEQAGILRSVSGCDRLVQLVEQCSRTGEVMTTYHKIIFIDSGGQPQFHEMLPAFLRRMSLYVFVFKLSEELASKPMVEYYDSNGKMVGTPYESAETNEQLLKHCLRTLNSHRTNSDNKAKPSRIMIVGTHRDKEGECTTETRAEKNKKLASLLLPTFKDKVTYSNLTKDEFIFAVNARDPQAEDKALAKNVQHLILTECCPAPVKVPLRYHCLEILLEEASETLGRGVLSIEECLEAAAELNFDKHSLDAALQFLDEISVVFYFPEVVEGVVFTNPQILLDKATEPVEEIYSLRSSTSDSGTVAIGDWKEFKDHALFTLSFLEKTFRKHYVPDLFTPVELVKIFKRFLIIAEFSATQYFMPALLEVLKEDKVNEHRVPRDSPAAALALDFPLGGPRLGTFCTLTCFLVSHNNKSPCPWKIVLRPNSNTPACLYRNCVQFSIPGYPGTIHLIDTFTHFEVHVRSSEEKYGVLCPLVRQAIFDGLKKAALTLGYNDCTPSPAVLCPCGEGSVHMATMGGSSWICKKDEGKYEYLTASHLVWKGRTIFSLHINFMMLSVNTFCCKEV